MNNTENIIIRKYEKEDGVAFPQEECLDEVSGAEFFVQQTYTAVAEDMETGNICPYYHVL